MTATATAPIPIERAPSRRRPVVIEITKAELVGDLMNAQARATTAIDANGFALEQVLRLPAGPWRSELQAAHIAAHDALVALLVELRLRTGIYEGIRPIDRA